MTDAAAVLGAQLADKLARDRLATNIYDALISSGSIRRTKRLTYRCQSRCELMVVILLEDGRQLVGFPRYKTSPTRTDSTSSPDGRRINTEDGWRRWKPQAHFWDDISNPVVSCDHLHGVTVKSPDMQADVAAQHADVIVRPDGSRYAR